MPLRPASSRLGSDLSQPRIDGQVSLVGVVVDRIGLGHPHHAAVDDVRGVDQADRVDLAAAQRQQVGVGARPEVVALEAEVFQAEAGLARVGHQVGRPVLEVLDPAELDLGLVDVDPVVGKGLGVDRRSGRR